MEEYVGYAYDSLKCIQKCSGGWRPSPASLEGFRSSLHRIKIVYLKINQKMVMYDSSHQPSQYYGECESLLKQHTGGEGGRRSAAPPVPIVTPEMTPAHTSKDVPYGVDGGKYEVQVDIKTAGRSQTGSTKAPTPNYIQIADPRWASSLANCVSDTESAGGHDQQNSSRKRCRTESLISEASFHSVADFNPDAAELFLTDESLEF